MHGVFLCATIILMKVKNRERTVLVAVLKSKKDQRFLLTGHWYRIPLDFLPKRRFIHLAFYQPAIFGRHGKRIEYYACVTARKVMKRIDLLPREPDHSRAGEGYMRFEVSRITKLESPIKNIIPRRVSFGFTSIKALHASKDILELYSVPKTEQIIAGHLARLGIKTTPEYTVSAGGRHYRIDLVVKCEKGSIAIECDNYKAHSSSVQKKKDKLKDIFLKKLGWRVLRFREKEILEETSRCIARVTNAIKSLGGQK